MLTGSGIMMEPLRGRPSPRNNDNYTRPDAPSRRHESSDSRSSVTSNASVPGMTDSSDSEVSLDDEVLGKTSASELLWDSFWPSPDNGIGGKDQYPAVLRPARAQGYFRLNISQQSLVKDDDSITVSPSEQSSPYNSPPVQPTDSQISPLRHERPKTPASYSIYPKQPLVAPRRVIPLPPRISSLDAELSASNTRLRRLKPSKSSHNLTLAPSALKKSSGEITPPLPSAVTAPVPSHPSYPPPPAPKDLRSTKSAVNLRGNREVRGHMAQKLSQHNATAPLTPLMGERGWTPVPVTPDRPRLQPQVSVFDFDSDAESDAEGNEGSFKKRFARGLHHKKKVSDERRPSTPRTAERATTPISRDEKEKRSNGRTRGGSLGRILGLKSR